MRKLVLLSSVFALSFGVFAQKDANAFSLGGLFGAATGIGQATEATLQQVLTNGETMLENTTERFVELYEQMRLQSQQQATVDAASTTTLVSAQSASNQARAITAQQQAMYGAYSRLNGMPAMACDILTATGSYGYATSETHRTLKENVAQDTLILAGGEGTPYAFGSADGDRLLYEQELALGECNASNSGGSRINCAPDGENRHITMASILTNDNISEDLQPSVNFFRTLMSNKRLPSLNPDNYTNPDTDTRGILMEINRTVGFGSIFSTIMSDVIANKTPPPGGRSIPYLRESLEEGDFLSEEMIADLLPTEGASRWAQIKAIVLAQNNPNFTKTKLLAEPDLINARIAYALNTLNEIQVKQTGLMEQMAIATGAVAKLMADEQAEKLAAKMRAKDSRN